MGRQGGQRQRGREESLENGRKMEESESGNDGELSKGDCEGSKSPRQNMGSNVMGANCTTPTQILQLMSSSYHRLW